MTNILRFLCESHQSQSILSAYISRVSAVSWWTLLGVKLYSFLVFWHWTSHSLDGSLHPGSVSPNSTSEHASASGLCLRLYTFCLTPTLFSASLGLLLVCPMGLYKAWPCVYSYPGDKEAVCHSGDEIVVISNSMLICVTERNLFSFSQAEFHIRTFIDQPVASRVGCIYVTCCHGHCHLPHSSVGSRVC